MLVTGYASDIAPAGYTGKGPYLYTSAGACIKIEDGILYHTADTDEGQSGSPCYSIDNFVLSIDSRGYYNGNDGHVPTPEAYRYNSGWAITVDFINRLISSGLYKL